MRSELYNAVEEATRNEFELLAELDGGAAWAAFLGRPLAGRGPLAILLLQAAEGDDGEFDLETADALDDGLPLGRTTCPACGTEDEGWPRFCPGCGTDLTGVPADAAVPGGSAEALLDEVRGAAAGVYEVLGAMPHAEGGGALYFAREAGTGRVVGLVLRYEADGDLDLALSWTPGTAGEADDGPVDAGELAPAAAAPDAFSPTPPAAVPETDVPAVFADEAGSRRSFFDRPPGRARDRSRDGGRRALGIAAVAIVGVSLVAALVLAIADPPTPGVAGDTLRQEVGVAPPGPGPAGGDGALAPTDTTAGSSSVPAAPDGSGGVRARPRPEPELSTRTASNAGTASPGGSTTSGPSSGTGGANPSTAATPPASVSASPPAAAPSPQGITDAVGRYATAVQSRQTSRISRAYPGITAVEVDRWERFFRPLGPDAGLEARYDVLSGPTVSGTRGEILFTLTLTYTDAAGKRVVMPLPLRAILEWTGGGWALREVRSYP